MQGAAFAFPSGMRLWAPFATTLLLGLLAGPSHAETPAAPAGAMTTYKNTVLDQLDNVRVGWRCWRPQPSPSLPITGVAHLEWDAKGSPTRVDVGPRSRASPVDLCLELSLKQSVPHPPDGKPFALDYPYEVGPLLPIAQRCDDADTYDKDADIAFDASCSSHMDPARTNVKYEWDFDYDRARGFRPTQTGKTVTKAGGFNGYKQWMVALRVTDDGAFPRTGVLSWSVVIKPPPHCPHPDPGGGSELTQHRGVYSGAPGDEIVLDASRSMDPDHDPLTYEWSDGTVVLGRTAKLPRRFPHEGVYYFVVKVTDNPTLNPKPYVAAPCTKSGFATVTIKPKPAAPPTVH